MIKSNKQTRSETASNSVSDGSSSTAILLSTLAADGNGYVISAKETQLVSANGASIFIPGKDKEGARISNYMGQEPAALALRYSGTRPTQSTKENTEPCFHSSLKI
jgi:hypothetical protein